MTARRTDVLADTGEGEPRDGILVTDTNDFYGNRGGYDVIKGLFGDDVVDFSSQYHFGFEHGAGEGLVSVRVYYDKRTKLWMTRVERSVQNDMHIAGGVVSTVNAETGIGEVSLVRAPRTPNTITGISFSRNEHGTVGVDAIRRIVPPDTRDPAALLLRRAANRANMQRIRTGHI